MLRYPTTRRRWWPRGTWVGLAGPRGTRAGGCDRGQHRPKGRSVGEARRLGPRPLQLEEVRVGREHHGDVEHPHRLVTPWNPGDHRAEERDTVDVDRRG